MSKNYENFMFEEAFEFHLDKPSISSIEHGYDENEQKLDVQQRVPPLGACSNDLQESVVTSESVDMKKFCELQENNEQLNMSLFALTSHFAQVQFRLKQIINGPKTTQEKLLSELEEFAFAGCPDVVGPNEKNLSSCSSCVSQHAIHNYEQRIAEEREREKRLDAHLKQMIANLECSQIQEKRKFSMKRNKKGYEKLSTEGNNKSVYYFPDQDNCLDVSDQEDSEVNDTNQKVPQEEIKKHIDRTMAKLINPKKAKQDIITQVSKQIHDMEKFMEFLKGYESTTEIETDLEISRDKQTPSSSSKAKNTARMTRQSTSSSTRSEDANNHIPAPHTKMLEINQERCKRIHQASVAVIKKSIAILQIFAISQFGCSARHFQEHMMRKKFSATVSTTGYLSPLQKLRSSIDQILILHTKLIDVGGLHPDSEDELNIPLSTVDKRASWSRRNRKYSRTLSRADSVSSQASSTHTIPSKSPEDTIQENLIRVVRGEFCSALKELLQHGLVQSFQQTGLSTKALVGCMSSQQVSGFNMHIWEYFNRFYKLKHGDKFNHQPSMMLSEAFGMDVGCTQQNPKQSLLTVLHRIKTTHEARKRSFDAMFKALVSAGLNRGRLAQWVRLVVRSPDLVDRHYERWSYVVKSGFDEVLTLLEKLSSLTFFLPEDLAIRHLLKNINEFGDA